MQKRFAHRTESPSLYRGDIKSHPIVLRGTGEDEAISKKSILLIEYIATIIAIHLSCFAVCVANENMNFSRFN